jgi:hypothetical protein
MSSDDQEIVLTAEEGKMVYVLPKLIVSVSAQWEATKGNAIKKPDWVLEAIKIMLNVRARCQDAIRKKDAEDRITGVYRSGYPRITALSGEMRRIADLSQWLLEKKHELNGTECPPRERWDRRYAESIGEL